MANTIIVPELFAKEVIRNRDIKNVFYNYTNRDYTGELRNAGDTVTVQTLPTLSFAAGTAGAEITATDFTITAESLVINTTKQLLVRVTAKEVTQSNLSLEEKIAGRFSEAEARLFDTAVRDQILVTQVADIPGANKPHVGVPVNDLSKTTIYAYIEELRVALANQNVTDNLVCFVSPQAGSYLLQSGVLDNSDMGLQIRQKGYLGMISGVKIVETAALTASKEIIMMQEGAVNMVAQLNQYKVTDGEKGFYTNLLAEIIYGLKIFGEQAKAIAICHVA